MEPQAQYNLALLSSAPRRRPRTHKDTSTQRPNILDRPPIVCRSVWHSYCGCWKWIVLLQVTPPSVPPAELSTGERQGQRVLYFLFSEGHSCRAEMLASSFFLRNRQPRLRPPYILFPLVCLLLLVLSDLTICSALIPRRDAAATFLKLRGRATFHMVVPPAQTRPSVWETQERLPGKRLEEEREAKERFISIQEGDAKPADSFSRMPILANTDSSSTGAEDEAKGDSEEGTSQASYESDDAAAVDETSDDADTSGGVSDRQMALYRAGLLKGNPKGRGQPTNEKKTSVGERRVGSATQARRGQSRTSQIVNAVRQKAQGITGSNPKTMSDTENGPDPDKTSARLAASKIHAAVEDLLREKKTMRKSTSQADRFSAAISSWGKSMGILGDEAGPPRSQVLCESPSLVVRVANPMDDVDIANLRLSVFSDFSPEMRSQFCYRSCQALARRRNCGAICVVATPPTDKVRPVLLGSAECSHHEFLSTRLGSMRPNGSLLYITEVAVHPSARRRGIGEMLLQSVERLATEQQIETIFLHVDVVNHGALALYKKCGYQLTNSDDPILQEFTQSLNLQPGATRGRTHHLLCKNLKTPTWIQGSNQEDTKVFVGNLGFEIPA